MIGAKRRWLVRFSAEVIDFVKMNGGGLAIRRSAAEAKKAEPRKGVRGNGAAVPAPLSAFTSRARGSALGSYCFRLSHGLAFQLDAICIVHQPVKDSVGHSRIADLLMPIGHGICEVRIVDRV